MTIEGLKGSTETQTPNATDLHLLAVDTVAALAYIPTQSLEGYVLAGIDALDKLYAAHNKGCYFVDLVRVFAGVAEQPKSHRPISLKDLLPAIEEIPMTLGTSLDKLLQRGCIEPKLPLKLTGEGRAYLWRIASVTSDYNFRVHISSSSPSSLVFA